MIRTVSLALVALGACLFAAIPAVAGEESGRHSGRVLDVKDGGRVLVLEEMGPWQGPNTGLAQRTIQVAPETPVRLVHPTGEWKSDTSPGYELKAATARDLKPGDFVTVTVGTDGRMAAAIELMRTDDMGLASPKLDTGK